MIEQVNGFITPMKGWDAVEKNDKKITGTENGTKSVFQSVLEDTVQNVYDTQKDVEQKQSSNRPGKSRTEPGSYDLS